MTTSQVQALSPVQQQAWRAFLTAHTQVTRRLEAELLTSQDLSLASYEVLVHLSEAPRHRLRMTELAESVLLSRSGLTRLVDRLERDGLVVRRACPSDARGTHAVLTGAGLDRLQAAWPTHLAGVQEHATGHWTDDEATVLAELLGRLTG